MNPRPRLLPPLAVLFGLLLPISFAFAQPPGPALPDPLQLPVATTLQLPLTAAYNALNVPSLPAGGSYLDPTTQVRIHKLTSATFPAAGSSWGHAYSEGGDEVSLPHTGSTRTIHVYTSNGSHRLIDFTPGVGVSNARELTGAFAPWLDLGFTFSNNPATPHYAYISTDGGSTIRRVDFRTMTEVPGDGWPVTGESEAVWLHQSANDGFFTWMRGANGSTVVGYEPSTGTKKTYTNSNINEPRIDRAGRYVGISMNLPQNQVLVWDWLANGIAWSTPNGEIPHAHIASVKGGWLGVNWNISFPAQFTKFTSQPGSVQMIGGPANGHLIHGNGNWIQSPADLRDQWAVFAHYGSLVPNPSWSWLAPGGMILITENGQRRLLAHPYNTTGDYTFYSFAKFSPDGKYVLFTSNMNGSARSDLFLAELPQTASAPDTTPPSVSLGAPATGAIVSGISVMVADASDDVGVAGVQFRLGGNDLGAEDTSAPFSVLWNTLLVGNGSHSLTAVARDAAGNSTTSSPVSVTVDNVIDVTPPILSEIAPSGVTWNGATIAWTTNEPADSQVEYGTTAAYGSSTALDPGLVTPHAQALSSLLPATLYHYRVRSRDAAGNLAVSGDFTFTTLAAPGPIAHWKLDEGSGLTTADASGNGNAGTLVNGPAWSAGRSGQAVATDGVNDYVRVAHAGALNAYPLSVVAWFKTSTSAGVRGLVNKYVAGSYNGYQIFFEAGGLCAWYLRDTSNYVYDGGGCTMSTPGYNDGQWHQVVFVVDAAGAKLYVDAVQRGSQPWTGLAGPPTTTQEIRLGHYPGAFGGAEYLPGIADEVRIYDRALSAAEVSQLFSELPPIDATPPVISAVSASSITSSGATVNWNTDEASDSQVEYGTTTAYGSSTVLDAGLVSAHSQPLSGLAGATLYHYRVLSRDAAGNLAVSGDFTFTTLDTTPPVISAVSALGVSSSGATISWTTDEASDSQVEYGTTTAYGSATTLVTSLVTAHSQPLTGLTAVTLYHYRVLSRDAAGNLAVSGDFTFTTIDTTPPVISAVSALGVSSSGATVNWTTDEAADSQVEYGTTTAYGSSTVLDAGLVSAHSQPLSGLAGATLYHYRVLSRDAAGNLAVSGDFTFTTLDTIPPVISAVSALGISYSGAAISWTTDEPADSQVEYGTTTAYGSSTTLDPGLVVAHSQPLSGLLASTLYHYRVRSRDAAANLAVSTDFTFTTPVAPGPIAHWKLDEGSGQSSADSAGSNVATLINGAPWSAGRSNQAVATDGANDYVRVAHAGALNAYPLSVAAWFKTSTISGVRGLVNKFVAGSYNGYQIFFDGGDLCAWYLRDASNHTYAGGNCTLRTPGFNDGLWHQVVLVVDAAGATLYVDAVQTGNQPWTGVAGPATTTQELRLGHYPGAFGGAEYLAGVVDEVRIYDRALSAVEISQLFGELPPISDTVPPTISAVAVGGVDGTSAAIAWDTDEPADSQVEYGTTTAYGSSTAVAPALVTTRSLPLIGLSPATLYHYRVRSSDAAANTSVSGDFTFTTPDTLAPIVSIDAPIGGQVVMGLVTISADASDNVGVAGVQLRVDGVAHGAELTTPPYSLSWDTTPLVNGSHILTAAARDAAGNTTVSAAVGVIVSNGDATAPVLTSVSASSVTSWGASIGWNTNEPADSQVEYGTTTAYGSSTVLAPGLVVSHSQALSGLLASTLYHYRVSSRDAAGNLAVSADFTFITLAAPAPIAYWKLDEGSGNTAADSAGTYTGTLKNGPLWTAGRSGLALSFDGTNDHVRAAHAGALDAFPLTVVAWFKTTTTSGTRGLVNKYVSNSYNGYQIFFENGSLCAWYLRSTSRYVYDGGTCTLRTPGFNDGQWHQVAFVVDASGGRLYVDGVLKASRGWTGTAGAPTTTQELRIGHYPGGSGNKYFPGTADEVRIYNRALTAGEILQLYGLP